MHTIFIDKFHIYNICLYKQQQFSFLICHTQFQIFTYTVHIIYNVYNLIQVVSYIMCSLLAVKSKTVNISCKSSTFTQTFLILLYTLLLFRITFYPHYNYQLQKELTLSTWFLSDY